MRFYLRTLGRPVPAGDPDGRVRRRVPDPGAILAAITKQIDVVLGGI